MISQNLCIRVEIIKNKKTNIIVVSTIMIHNKFIIFNKNSHIIVYSKIATKNKRYIQLIMLL